MDLYNQVDINRRPIYNKPSSTGELYAGTPGRFQRRDGILNLADGDNVNPFSYDLRAEHSNLDDFAGYKPDKLYYINIIKDKSQPVRWRTETERALENAVYADGVKKSVNNLPLLADNNYNRETLLFNRERLIKERNKYNQSSDKYQELTSEINKYEDRLNPSSTNEKILEVLKDINSSTSEQTRQEEPPQKQIQQGQSTQKQPPTQALLSSIQHGLQLKPTITEPRQATSLPNELSNVKLKKAPQPKTKTEFKSTPLIEEVKKGFKLKPAEQEEREPLFMTEGDRLLNEFEKNMNQRRKFIAFPDDDDDDEFMDIPGPRRVFAF